MYTDLFDFNIVSANSPIRVPLYFVAMSFSYFIRFLSDKDFRMVWNESTALTLFG